MCSLRSVSLCFSVPTLHLLYVCYIMLSPVPLQPFILLIYLEFAVTYNVHWCTYFERATGKGKIYNISGILASTLIIFSHHPESWMRHFEEMRATATQSRTEESVWNSALPIPAYVARFSDVDLTSLFESRSLLPGAKSCTHIRSWISGYVEFTDWLKHWYWRWGIADGTSESGRTYLLVQYWYEGECLGETRWCAHFAVLLCILV